MQTWSIPILKLGQFQETTGHLQHPAITQEKVNTEPMSFGILWEE